MLRFLALAAPLTLLIGLAPARSAEPPKATTPKAHFGFNLGDDYCLANYEQYAAYLGKLEKESDRIKVVNIGQTAEKRKQLMAVVTSPANHQKLDAYRTIARKLAEGELEPELAKRLAAEGKAVVFVSSYLTELLAVCDRIAVLSRGRLRDVRPAAEWNERTIMSAAIAGE